MKPISYIFVDFHFPFRVLKFNDPVKLARSSSVELMRNILSIPKCLYLSARILWVHAISAVASSMNYQLVLFRERYWWSSECPPPRGIVWRFLDEMFANPRQDDLSSSTMNFLEMVEKAHLATNKTNSLVTPLDFHWRPNILSLPTYPLHTI